MKKLLVFSLIVLTLVISACGPQQTPVPPSDPSVKQEECVHPESDNSYSWSYDSCVPVPTQAYTLTIQVRDEIVNHTEVQGSGSGFYMGGYGSVSMRIWQDGKGLLPVGIISIEPMENMFVDVQFAVIKTADLKAMGVPNGAFARFICNLDVEVLSPVQNFQVLTTDRLTYEFDDCRMLDLGKYWFDTSGQ